MGNGICFLIVAIRVDCTDYVLEQPHNVQKGEVQSPVPGQEQPQAPGHAWGHPAGKELYRKGPGPGQPALALREQGQ